MAFGSFAWVFAVLSFVYIFYHFIRTDAIQYAQWILQIVLSILTVVGLFLGDLVQLFNFNGEKAHNDATIGYAIILAVYLIGPQILQARSLWDEGKTDACRHK